MITMRFTILMILMILLVFSDGGGFGEKLGVVTYMEKEEEVMVVMEVVEEVSCSKHN
jgi:hypothetical protein